MAAGWIVLIAVVVVLAAIVVYDLIQRHHAILRNFPVIGHFRYLLEKVGPELRQYIVTSNDEERPFSRDQRRWVYATSKQEVNTFGFGTDNEVEHVNSYLIFEHALMPAPPPADGTTGAAPEFLIPCTKVIGGPRGRPKAWRPESVVHISGMSFGALSGRAIEALNRGAALARCHQDTGEGGLSPAHRAGGGDLVFQIASGYFGCRTKDGRFSLDMLKETLADAPVRALEIKLSQGAKPGLGGHLPGAKVTPEIAKIRGVPAGQDCISPPGHSAFRDTDELLDFVEMLAAETGLPVGIKSAVGREEPWEELARLMEPGDRGVDFIVIDGGEGGTGAAPLVFADHVALPFKLGFARAFTPFARRGIAERTVWVGSGRLGFPDHGLFAFALGADMINVGREAMLSVGCIQAQRCHTGTCPTGVATQNPRLARGLEPRSKSVRCANYIRGFRGELLSVCRSTGVVHPALMPPTAIQLVDEGFRSRTVEAAFGYDPAWRAVTPERRAEIEALIGTEGHPRAATTTPGADVSPAPVAPDAA